MWSWLEKIVCGSCMSDLDECEKRLKGCKAENRELDRKVKTYRAENRELDRKCKGYKEKIGKLKKRVGQLNNKLDRWIRGKLDVKTVKKDNSWIQNQINDRYPNASIKPLDRTGLFVSKEDAKRIVKSDLTDSLEYVRSSWDCENFAYLFASLVKKKYGIDVGIVLDLDAHHAYNMWIYSDGEVELFEPQTDQFGPSGEHYNPNTRTTVEFF